MNIGSFDRVPANGAPKSGPVSNNQFMQVEPNRELVGFGNHSMYHEDGGAEVACPKTGKHLLLDDCLRAYMDASCTRDPPEGHLAACRNCKTAIERRAAIAKEADSY